MVGVDLSPKAIGMAKKIAASLALRNIDYFAADVEDLNLFADDTFDGAVSFSTLRYVPHLEQALKEIHRVLKPGAACALDFPNKYCPWFGILKNRFGVENHIHDHFFSARELAALFRKVGFHDIDTKKIMFTHYTFRPDLLKYYRIVDWIGERTFVIKELAAIIVCKGIKA